MIQKINYADKQTGGKFSASDANEIKSTVNLNADVLSENSQSILSLQGGQLGSIKPTDVAPTPERNGNYTFSIGGDKPAWLTAEDGITTVKAGDGVAVVYTEPSSYTYMHVDMSSDFVTIQKLKDLGYLFKGIATPTTDPGTPDGNLFYFATEVGIYANFSAIEITKPGIYIFKYISGWTSINLMYFENPNSFNISKLSNNYAFETSGQARTYCVMTLNIIPQIGDFISYMLESGVFVTEKCLTNSPGSSNSDWEFQNDTKKTIELIKNNDNISYKSLFSKIENSNMLLYNNWEYSLGSDFMQKTDGNIHLSFTPGQNQAIKLVAPEIFVGHSYKLRLICTASKDMQIKVGDTIGSSTSALLNEIIINIKSGKNEYIIDITSAVMDATPYLSIGTISALNTGGTLDIHYFSTVEETALKKIEPAVTSTYLEDYSVVGELTLTDVGVNGLQVNTPLSSNTGFLNSNVQGIEPLKHYIFKTRMRKISGYYQKVRIGIISTMISSGIDAIDVELTEEWVDYTYKFKNLSDVDVINPGFTLLSSMFTGATFQIQFTQIIPEGTLDYLDNLRKISDSLNVKIPLSFNLEQTFNSLSKYDKPLIKLAVEGDSLMANELGGLIPDDEGFGKNPMRLLSNTISRRIYDLLSWNKPIYRRLDNGWTWHGSVAPFTESGMFSGTQEVYHRMQTYGDYVEITIPDGFENFALICRTLKDNGTIGVSINGALPGTYLNPLWVEKCGTNAVVNESLVPHYLPIAPATIDTDKGVSLNGNPYHTVLFHNLPIGQPNVIRLSRVSSVCDIWGGAYWSGNTLMVMNIAHGGHSTSDLIAEHLEDELYNADYDAVLFELPEMNNTRLSLDQTLADLQVINTEIENKGLDVCYMSCNPLGLSITSDTNYYADLQDPTQKQINDLVRNFYYETRKPFIDIFEYFRQKIEAKGGTLENGEGGLWYTHDGQHQSEAGMREYWNLIRFLFENKPIRY